MKKSRVLVVCQHFWPETFRITDICRGLVDEGYEVDVLCGIPNYPMGRFFEGYGFFKNRKQILDGIKIIRVPEIPRGNNSNFRIFINYISFTIFSLFYIPLLLTKRYDRIFVYQLSPVFMSLPGILVAKLKRKKLYIYICDFWPHSLFSIINFRNKFMIRLITNISYWHYKQADGVIGAFKGIQYRLINEVGIDQSRTLYIPQVAEKIYESDVRNSELEKRFANKFNIVFAGSINPAQSFDTIVEAASLLKKNHYKNIRFIIIGDGMSRLSLEASVKSEHLSKFFVFEGHKPYTEIPQYQNMADALLVALTKSPLFEYGIPAKIQSYLPAGKPILGAMDGDGQSLINVNRCGICVDSGDAKGLAKAIMDLYNAKPSYRHFLGKNARTYHYTHFNRDANLSRLTEFVFNDNRIEDNEYVDYPVSS